MLRPPYELLRINHSDSNSRPVGPRFGRGGDSISNRMRKNLNTPEKQAVTIQLLNVLEKAPYKGIPFEYEY